MHIATSCSNRTLIVIDRKDFDPFLQGSKHAVPGAMTMLFLVQSNLLDGHTIARARHIFDTNTTSFFSCTGFQ